jgi:hypothetical protein
MKVKSKLSMLTALVFTALFGLAACEKGPAEKAGAELDDAAKSVSEAMEDAAKKVDEAIDE